EISRVAEKIDANAKAAEMNICMKQVADTEIYPHLLLFPFPIQQLLVQQYNPMDEGLSEGKNMVHVGGDSISCYCKFFCRYQLPCQHILHSDYLYNILDSNKWEVYARDFQG